MPGGRELNCSADLKSSALKCSADGIFGVMSATENLVLFASSFRGTAAASEKSKACSLLAAQSAHGKRLLTVNVCRSRRLP